MTTRSKSSLLLSSAPTSMYARIYIAAGTDNIYGVFVRESPTNPSFPFYRGINMIQCRLDGSSGVKKRFWGRVN
ncbi:hypothetical protein ANTQUA_LOCUS6395 [Anthophora quadrimaculata]